MTASDRRLLLDLKRYLAARDGQCGAIMEACKVSESTVRRWAAEDRLPQNAVIRQILADLLAKATAS